MATMKAMACPICTTLERDERLLREAVEECVEALRRNLPADVRRGSLRQPPGPGRAVPTQVCEAVSQGVGE